MDETISVGEGKGGLLLLCRSPISCSSADEKISTPRRQGQRKRQVRRSCLGRNGRFTVLVKSREKGESAVQEEITRVLICDQVKVKRARFQAVYGAWASEWGKTKRGEGGASCVKL